MPRVKPSSIRKAFDAESKNIASILVAGGGPTLLAWMYGVSEAFFRNYVDSRRDIYPVLKNNRWRRSSAVKFVDIEGFPGYRVGDDGSVWCCKSQGKCPRLTDVWRMMSPSLDARGAMCVQLHQNKRAHTRFVHRLVLEAFVGPCPDGMEACHGDGDPANNHKDNLRWDTHAGNMGDRIKHGTELCGEKNPGARLRQQDVEQIFVYRKSGMTYKEIAQIYDVSDYSIRSIIKGRRWKHLGLHEKLV